MREEFKRASHREPDEIREKNVPIYIISSGCSDETRNLPPRQVIASLVYGYGAFVHEIRYKTWANKKSERIK